MFASCKQASFFYCLILLVIVDDRVHEVHHGFGCTEDALHFIEPVVSFEEGVRDSVPSAIVLQAQVLHVWPVFWESRGTCLQLCQAKALWLIPTANLSSSFFQVATIKHNCISMRNSTCGEISQTPTRDVAMRIGTVVLTGSQL